MITFGEVLKDICVEKGYTQAELAKRAGITESAVCHYIKGDRVPHLEQFYKLCNALELDTNDVLYWCYGNNVD